MRKRIHFLFLILLLVQACPLAAASVQFSNIVLYQPDAVLQERMGDVQPLAAYLKKIQEICDASFTTEEREGVDVVVVLKPGSQSRVWFVSSLKTLPDRSTLKAAIETISPPVVRGGPVVFALSYNLNGFNRPSPPTGKFEPPIPTEWTEKVKDVKGPLQVPDGLIPYVWPDPKKS
jgi:hypothetical protein